MQPWSESLKAFKIESSFVKILRKTLIALWHRCYAKIILDKNSFSVPMLWLPWHFELDVWCWMPANFRVRNRRYLRGHPDGFSWLAKNLADCGSAQNTQLLEGFFARTEFLALADINFSSPSAKKEIEVMSKLLLLTVLTIYSRKQCPAPTGHAGLGRLTNFNIILTVKLSRPL